MIIYECSYETSGNLALHAVKLPPTSPVPAAGAVSPRHLDVAAQGLHLPGRGDEFRLENWWIYPWFIHKNHGGNGGFPRNGLSMGI